MTGSPLGDLSLTHWQRLNVLLRVALELDPAARDTWLEAQTGEAPELRDALGKLLAEHASGVSHVAFDSPPHELASQALEELHLHALEDRPGDILGPYRLIEPLGQGGMACVWVAERADGALTRQVALKVPLVQWEKGALAQRVRRECAILASLNHPGIAQLYDAGWSQSGRPYLALELVKGQPIDQACRDKGLSIEDRLRLFIDVLRAVAYAHARLVVHRDLKPSNVLLTEQGRIKLLDFGIAKILEDDSASVDATELTRLSGRPLTLSYAAPEQVLGKPINTAADIYALGAMLYELLSGRRYLSYAGNSAHELERAILEHEPVAPSVVASDGNSAEGLHADLDAIILKALQKDPDLRYESAAAFADDIQRFLHGVPVLARPVNRWYRASRFIARNRFVVTATGAMSIALLTGVGLVWWQAGIASTERDRALRAVAHSEAVNVFLTDLLLDADRAGRPVTVPEVINRAKRLADSEFSRVPEAKAAVLRQIANFKMDMEGADSAAPIIDEAIGLLADSGDLPLKAGLQCDKFYTDGLLGRDSSVVKRLTAAAQDGQVPANVAAECWLLLANYFVMKVDGSSAIDATRHARERWQQSPEKLPSQSIDIDITKASALAMSGRIREAEAGFEAVRQALRQTGREQGSRAEDLNYSRLEMLVRAGSFGHALRVLVAMEDRFHADFPGRELPAVLRVYRGAILFYSGDFEQALTTVRAAAAQASQGDQALWKRAKFFEAASLAGLGRMAEAERVVASASHTAAVMPEAQHHVAVEPWDFTRATIEIQLAERKFPDALRSVQAVLARADLTVDQQWWAYRMLSEAQLGLGLTTAALDSANRDMDLASALRGDLPSSAWTAQTDELLGKVMVHLQRVEKAEDYAAAACEQWRNVLDGAYAAHPECG